MPLFDQGRSPSKRLCELAAWNTVHAYWQAHTIEQAAALGARFFRRDPLILWTTGNGQLNPKHIARICAKESKAQNVANSSPDIVRLFSKLAQIHDLGMWTNDGQAGLDERMPFWGGPSIPVRQRAYLAGVIRASRRAQFEQLCINRGLLPFHAIRDMPITEALSSSKGWETVTFASTPGQLKYVVPLESSDRAKRRERWTQMYWLTGLPRARSTGKSILAPLIDDLTDNGAHVEFVDPVWGRESFVHDVFIDALRATR